MPSICLDDTYRGEKILSAFRSSFETYNKSQTSYQWKLKQEECGDNVCVRKGEVEIQKKIKIVASLFEKKVRWWIGECWRDIELKISVEINPKAWNISRVFWEIDASFRNYSIKDWFLKSKMYEAIVRGFVCALFENDQ